MNPSKMRDTYGKLMYILMDTESHTIKSELRLNFIKPILTVTTFLEERNSLDVLADPLWQSATRAVQNADGDKTAHELALETQRKAAAEQALKTKYTSADLTADDIQRVIDSIADNEAFLSFNMTPVSRIINILTESFDPKNPVDPFSLKLTGGGAMHNTKKLFSSFRYFFLFLFVTKFMANLLHSFTICSPSGCSFSYFS
jgi:hypothetical protein